MKFYISLTTGDGILLDRFRLELPDNPTDEIVSEDSEALGNSFCHEDLCNRLARAMRQALKVND